MDGWTRTFGCTYSGLLCGFSKEFRTVDTNIIFLVIVVSFNSRRKIICSTEYLKKIYYSIHYSIEASGALARTLILLRYE